jgi:hypothetical protein
VRWFQWGAFCPLFRNHGSRHGGPSQEGGDPACGTTSGSNEIWNFGSESEEAIARVMKLREQIRPYVMAQYEAAANNGTPVMRPLFFDFWTDSHAATIDSQMMFGPDYLVAPQLTQGATNRSVYLPQLPPGQVWRNVFTTVDVNTTLGGVNITEATPLTGDGFGTFPLYFRTTLTPYPGPPPPLPCDGSCTTRNSTDAASGGGLIDHVNSTSVEDCCAKCKASSTCESFVWGLYDHTTGPPTCFFLKAVTGLKTSVGRTYGCVRP